MHSSCTITLEGNYGVSPAAPPVVDHLRPFPPLELLHHASACLRASTGVDGMRGTSPHLLRIVVAAADSGRWHRRWCRKIRRWQDGRMAELMMGRQGEEGVCSTPLNPLPTLFDGVVLPALAVDECARAGRFVDCLVGRRSDARRRGSSVVPRRHRGAAYHSITSPAIVVPRRWSAGDDAGLF